LEIGYTLSSEEHGPRELMRFAATAEDLGFDFLSISDHFHPWVDAQGHSPFVWSTLGAVAAVTERVGVGVGVCCPILRVHPAIVAHASATVATMMPGRFFLGVGTGELLNEHILGQKWPRVEERREMLIEAVELIRQLWTGEVVDYDGEWFRVENARLYTLPDEPPPIVMSGFGPESARTAGEMDCGLWITGPDTKVVDEYRAAGGSRDIIGQLTVCWDRDEDTALDIVQRVWPTAGLAGGQLSQELPSPPLFEQACQNVRREDLAKAVVCGNDAGKVIEAAEEYRRAGFTRLHIHQIGERQDYFFDAWQDELRDALTAVAHR
jgi:coenzyme F420-dependent glucose-6-phosphate dehydrogenase